MDTHAIINFQSRARRWAELVGNIEDALFDAQHSAAGLRGARPSLQVLLSRDLLRLEGSNDITGLRQLSRRLQQQDVPHSFHCAFAGSAEPGAHMIWIILE